MHITLESDESNPSIVTVEAKTPSNNVNQEAFASFAKAEEEESSYVSAAEETMIDDNWEAQKTKLYSVFALQ